MECLSMVLLILFVACIFPNAISFPRSENNEYKSELSCMHEENSAGNDQAEAVQKLLQRLIPYRAHEFLINIDFNLGSKDKDTYQIESRNGKILVTGNRGYAAAHGVHHYLKYFCGCHVSWSGYQLSLPQTLPQLPTPLRRVSNDRYRYYMNVCTMSYSTVWWEWRRWEREIDWMALNGINLPLAFTGQEAIYKKVFKSLNFTDHDIDEFFTGPAFLAWNRMGNVQGWAGALSENWLSQQANLQHKILARMRSFGMDPVLPAFSGRVPPNAQRIFPNASITYLNKAWGHFDPPYSPVAFLQPTDPLFQEIAEMFLSEYTTEFGTNHMYNVDPFNEMPPPSNETEYLKECSHAVYQSMLSFDPNATWILQGWMFFSDAEFWTESRAEAFLTAVPIGRMIVLDLQAELYPEYPRLNSFYGQPFIWCMVQNFGGVQGLYGSLDNINIGPFVARNYNESTMIGTGLAPEGIETNDIVYELMNEIAWRSQPVALEEWIANFTVRRYGVRSVDVIKAWELLGRSVYNATVPFRNHGKYILTKRPSLKLNVFIWYDKQDVVEAWKLFISSSKNISLRKSKLFRHDLVDLTRQGLQLAVATFYDMLCKAYFARNLSALREASTSILALYDDLEYLLASDIHFLLGRWLESAKTLAITPEERRQYEYNARNQITLWGPSGQILDYAAKQWAGLISAYYRKRWKLFAETLEDCLESSTRFNQSNYNDNVLRLVATPFTLGNESYPVQSKGSSARISQKLFRKYWRLIKPSPDHLILRKFPARFSHG